MFLLSSNNGDLWFKAFFAKVILRLCFQMKVLYRMSFLETLICTVVLKILLKLIFFLEIYKSNGRFDMSCLFTGIIIRTTVFRCHLRRIYLNSVVNISEWCDDNTCHFFKKQSVTCIYINIFFSQKWKAFAKPLVLGIIHYPRALPRYMEVYILEDFNVNHFSQKINIFDQKQ